jgi:hypothetical protein
VCFWFLLYYLNFEKYLEKFIKLSCMLRQSSILYAHARLSLHSRIWLENDKSDGVLHVPFLLPLCYHHSSDDLWQNHMSYVETYRTSSSKVIFSEDCTRPNYTINSFKWEVFWTQCETILVSRFKMTTNINWTHKIVRK